MKSIGNDSSPGSAGQFDIIDEYTAKIDDFATSGLLGTSNSLSYRVHEIEQHFHVAERWFGQATTPSGTAHVADRIGPSINPFRLTAGNNAWGSWVQILGSTDTPADSGKIYFDPHRMHVPVAGDDVTYFVQFTRGDDPDVAWAAGMGTEIIFTAVSNIVDGGEIDIRTGRAPVGSKVWARTMSPGNNADTIDFYIGIHEYIG